MIQMLSFVLLFSMGVANAAVRTEIFNVEDEIRQQVSILNQQNAEKYSVLLYGDRQLFEPHRLGSEIRRIEHAFGHPVLAYEIKTGDDFISVLQELSQKQYLIATLTMRGIHGGNYEGIPDFAVVNREYSENTEDDETNYDWDTIPFASLSQRGVRLNFTADVFVFITACQLVEDKTIEQLRKGIGYMKDIGFTSGWFYLNQTFGAEAFNNIYKVPFYARSGSKVRKVKNGILQIIGWPVIAPTLYYMDRFKNNQGYLFGVSKRHEVILKARAYDVQNGKRKGLVIHAK